MVFQVILKNMEAHIFISSPTFHGTTIGNHDLKIVDNMDIEIEFLRKAMMNEIMSAATVNWDDEFLVLNVTNQFEGLGSIKTSESIQ
jgi:hypothetical protein